VGGAEPPSPPPPPAPPPPLSRGIADMVPRLSLANLANINNDDDEIDGGGSTCRSENIDVPCSPCINEDISQVPTVANVGGSVSRQRLGQRHPSLRDTGKTSHRTAPRRENDQFHSEVVEQRRQPSSYIPLGKSQRQPGSQKVASKQGSIGGDVARRRTAPTRQQGSRLIF
jgi:hypothetical protein